MSNTQVVVTGMGATTPLGGDLPTTWEAMLAGRSGVRPLEDWPESQPVRIAATAAVDPAEVLERVRLRRLDRCAQFAVIAADEAWRHSGLEEVDKDRLAVVVGTGIGGFHTLLGNYDVLLNKGPRQVSPLAIPMLMPNGAAAQVGLALGARAAVHAPVSACASGNEAIAQAVDLIRGGRADVVVVGGAEAAIHPLPMAAFANMMALSRRNEEPARASRPFDKARDGFVLGEGAAIMVVESAEHAAARGATVYAEVAGAGVTADSHHIAQPEPEGLGASRAMAAALRDASVEPEEVRHINAHATSTPQGDIAEAVAVRRVLGDATDDVLVTSTKSMTGHLLGAAGALESIATVLAMHHRVVPPTTNLDDPDDEIRLDVVSEPRALPGGDLAGMNNSFGFGGHNVAIVFRST